MLRPYQQAAADVALARLANGGATLIAMPTGSGKSHVIAEIARRHGGPTLIVTHVKELVEQDAAKLRAAGLSVDIYCAGLGLKDTGDCTAGSVQSLVRAADLPRYDLVIIDEAHRIPINDDSQYRALLNRLQPHALLGLTATPFRSDSGILHGDGAMFADCCYRVGLMELVRDGWLASLTAKAGLAAIDVRGLRKSAGEYLMTDAADRLMPKLRAALEESLRRASERKRWLVFAPTIGTCETASEILTELGVTSDYVHSRAPWRRDATLAQFRAGALRAIVNVDVLTTGFDLPDIDCLVLLRPTASPVLYAQILGRGMRTAPRKTNCLMLDFAGNVQRMGPLDRIEATARRASARDDDERDDDDRNAPLVQMHICPGCQELVESTVEVCPDCGARLIAPTKDPALTDAPYAGDEIMSGGSRWRRVTGWQIGLHRKPGKPPSVRVTYGCYGETITEWLCIEHGGYAARMAARRAADMGVQLRAGTTASDLAWALRDAGPPTQIMAEHDGTFWRVLDRSYD